MNASEYIPTPDNWHWPSSQSIRSARVKGNAVIVQWDNDNVSKLLHARSQIDNSG